MTSKIKVDNINKVSDDSNIIKKCGSTTTVGSGSGTIVVDGSTVTLGRCGGTVALASGATQSGFGRTGTVDWQTSIKTAASFTAVNGEGYFVDTSSNAVTANLPAGSVGAIVSFKDYAQNFDTNALTIAANGSEKIEGQTFDLIINTKGAAVTLVYGDATKGWQAVNSNEIVNSEKFVTATGGTETTSGNFKIHSFTGPGTFSVTCGGNPAGSNTVDYVVVAGGGGGGGSHGAGGGAGGYREAIGNAPDYTASPLASSTALAVSTQCYPITVGAGGTTGFPGPGGYGRGTSGANSIFSTITSTGGGGGATGCNSPDINGFPGGSGGGGSTVSPSSLGCKGSGNTPPVSPPQGKNGGDGTSDQATYRDGGGGGGATVGGTSHPNPSSPPDGNPGGAGTSSSITASPVTYAGGGGGGGSSNGGSGGSGGGGTGGTNGSGTAGSGTANKGGGAGGAGGAASDRGGSGGSGVVVIRYKFQ
jgi:hypothetical protein